MKNKRILSLIICCILLLILSSCKEDLDNYTTKSNEEFCYLTNDDGTISIGSVRDNYSSSIVFVPYEIEEMPVRQLGYESGLGFGGYGYLQPIVSGIEEDTKYKIEKYYAPASINKLSLGYLKYTRNLEVFYCGEVLDLNIIAGDETIFYVPNEKYDEFYNTISVSIYSDSLLFIANISYILNYDGDYTYYYIDNCDYGSLIENIPPDPIREGYTFGGWYTEPECLNKWDFNINKLLNFRDKEEYIETRLYAKWY